jgi:hypothetical protein
MIDGPEPQQMIPNPRVPTNTTESGELERPLLRRKIDCGPGIESPLDRRIAARGGRRRDDARL